MVYGNNDLPITLGDLPALLAYISPEDREVWVQVGMGIKSEYGDTAYDEFINWSQGGSTFNKNDCKTVWQSFKKIGVGFGTVVKLAQDNGWRPEKKTLSAAEKNAFKKQEQERRNKLYEEAQANEKLNDSMRAKVSNACQLIIKTDCSIVGRSPYLIAKQVKPHGVYFIKYSTLLVVNFKSGVEQVSVLTMDEVSRFFKELPKPRPDTLSYLKMERKGFVIPLVDINNNIQGFQYINEQGTKLFPKFCQKSGSFHVIGTITEHAEVICFAEGYATAASVFEATGYPTVVTFDAGNLLTVAKLFHKKYPQVFKVIAGDDDNGNEKNKGREKAEQAAKECWGVAVFPEFLQDKEA